MEPARIVRPSTPEPLTWAEICERYPEEQLCLADVEYLDPEQHEVRTARVIGHGASVGAAFEQARLLQGRFDHITFCATQPWFRHQALRPRLVLDDDLHELCFGPR
jgi:hypothetical protein